MNKVFIYSACKPLKKNKERIQKFKETSVFMIYIYQSELAKACFSTFHGLWRS